MVARAGSKPGSFGFRLFSHRECFGFYSVPIALNNDAAICDSKLCIFTASVIFLGMLAAKSIKQ
jgi:hypothetical protein